MVADRSHRQQLPRDRRRQAVECTGERRARIGENRVHGRCERLGLLRDVRRRGNQRIAAIESEQRLERRESRLTGGARAEAG